MNIDEVKEFLNTDDGTVLLNELKQPLLNKRDELLESVKTLKTQMAEITSKEEKRLVENEAKHAETEAARLKDAGDFDAYKAFHEEEISKRDQATLDLRSRFAKTEVNRLVALTASKHSTSPMPLQLLLRERVKTSFNEAGDLQISVNDEAGKQMYYEGQPADINHLIEALKNIDDYAQFFSATGSSGSGTVTPDNNTQTTGEKDMNSDNFNLTKTMGNKI